MLHVISAQCVARDLHTVVLSSLECMLETDCNAVRRCKKSWTVCLSAIIKCVLFFLELVFGSFLCILQLPPLPPPPSTSIFGLWPKNKCRINSFKVGSWGFLSHYISKQFCAAFLYCCVPTCVHVYKRQYAMEGVDLRYLELQLWMSL